MKISYASIRATRTARLKRLRAHGAPRWIIRSEQVACALAREGLLHRGIGARWSRRQEELYERFVTPAFSHAQDG